MWRHTASCGSKGAAPGGLDAAVESASGGGDMGADGKGGRRSSLRSGTTPTRRRSAHGASTHRSISALPPSSDRHPPAPHPQCLNCRRRSASRSAPPPTAAPSSCERRAPTAAAAAAAAASTVHSVAVTATRRWRFCQTPQAPARVRGCFCSGCGRRDNCRDPPPSLSTGRQQLRQLWWR